MLSALRQSSLSLSLSLDHKQLIHGLGAAVLRQRLSGCASASAIARIGLGAGVAARFASTKVNFEFLEGGKLYKISAEPSKKNLLEIAHANGINLEGACEGSCACATCHLVFDKDVYAKLSPPSEDEEDMLDMAQGLTPTSRLGCQVVISDALEGAVVVVPSVQRNMWVDGAVPTPH